MYHQLTPEIVSQIKAVSGNVFEGADINPDYAKDEMPIYGTRMPDLAVPTPLHRGSGCGDEDLL